MAHAGHLLVELEDVELRVAVDGNLGDVAPLLAVEADDPAPEAHDAGHGLLLLDVHHLELS